MEEVIPWTKLLAVIEPHYPMGERGRPPIGLERMLRVYFLQQWYALADEALEDALYDSQALQHFARVDLSAEGVPDATTLLKFRGLLETHDLCKGLFSAINTDLTARGLLLREGTLVAATLIAAPPSTKNQKKERDPEMHQTKKGNQWFFGMKAHIGADRDSKLFICKAKRGLTVAMTRAARIGSVNLVCMESLDEDPLEMLPPGQLTCGTARSSGAGRRAAGRCKCGPWEFHRS